MTVAERKFLQVVKDHSGARAGYLGAEAYCGGRMPQHYARPAANVLNRLETQGLVSPNP